MSEIPRLAVRSVEDSLGIIPHLLGFHPEESLVVAVIVEGRVELTARADLRPLSAPGQLELLFDRLWRRYPRADAWCVAYTADHSHAWEVLARCQGLLSPSTLRRMIHVDGNRFWCDSPLSEPGRHDPGSTVLAAEATVLGLPARQSRSELSGLVAGPPASRVSALRDVFELIAARLREKPLHAWPGVMDAALAAGLSEPPRLDDEQCALLALLSACADARDRALTAITRETSEQHVALWSRVISRCLVTHQAFPLALMGMAAWISGNGALQVVCLERAQQLLPDAGLVRILVSINDAVLPPSQWETLRPQLVAQLGSSVRSGSRRSGRRRR